MNASQTVTVNYATANGTATTANNDYAAASGTLSFTPSAATRTISVTINGDTTVESNETFVVNLSGATNATIGDAQATGTITNDDAAAQPTLTIGDVTVTEGNSGTSLATFTVTLSPVNTSQTVTVNYATANGTATTSDNDYETAGGTLTFAPSAATRTLSVTINGDTAVEPNETFAVSLSGATNAAIGDGQATGTITNNDAAAQSTLAIGDVTITEGNSGSSVATFTVTLSPVNASQTVTVNYATANGTATTIGNDYEAASGTLTFAPSAATRTLNVTINGDTTVEPNQTFLVNLSSATNATIGNAQAIGTITNDDVGVAAGPTVNVTTTSVAPGGLIQFTVSGGPGNRMDWVTLSPASAANNGYVDWSYLNGTKTAPSTGRTSATLQFTAPSTPGTYNVRFFANNSLATRLATSANITVATQPTLTIGRRHGHRGQQRHVSGHFHRHADAGEYVADRHRELRHRERHRDHRQQRLRGSQRDLDVRGVHRDADVQRDDQRRYDG